MGYIKVEAKNRELHVQRSSDLFTQPCRQKMRMEKKEDLDMPLQNICICPSRGTEGRVQCSSLSEIRLHQHFLRQHAQSLHQVFHLPIPLATRLPEAWYVRGLNPAGDGRKPPDDKELRALMYCTL